MVTDDALEDIEMKPLMCHFWRTIYHMRQVSFQSFCLGFRSEISRNAFFYPTTVLLRHLTGPRPRIGTNGRLAKSLTACQQTFGFPSNSPTRRQVMSRYLIRTTLQLSL